MRCNHPGGVLETPRLTLRPPWDSDLNALSQLYGLDEVGNSLKLGVLTPQATAELLSDYRHMWIEHGFGTRMIVKRDSGEFMGEVGLRMHERTSAPAMRYALHPDFWGHGYAREGVQATLDDAFHCVGLVRVDAFTRGANESSVRILKACGGEVTDERDIPAGILYKYSFFKDAWLEQPK